MGIYLLSIVEDVDQLEGSVLVMIPPYTLKESCWSPENQLWLATGGFGCSLALPQVGLCTPPVWAMANKPAGTAATSSAFSKRKICPIGQGKV